MWDEPYLWKYYVNQVIQRCLEQHEVQSILHLCHTKACGGHFGPQRTAKKVIDSDFYWPNIFRGSYALCAYCERCKKSRSFTLRNLPLTPILVCGIFDVWGIDFMGPFLPSFGFSFILTTMNNMSKWVEVKDTPANDSKVVVILSRTKIFPDLAHQMH